jgi:hypothetical protein
MAALAIFQPWIWVEVGVGKFLIELSGKNIFLHKITCSGSVLTSGWLAGCFIALQLQIECSNGLKNVHRETGTE